MLWWTLRYTCLFQFWFPRCVCPEWDCWVLCRSISSFLRNVHTVLHSGSTCLHSHQQYKRVRFFPLPFPAFVCRIFDSSHSVQCEMVLHCGFDLHFSDNEWCWALIFAVINNHIIWIIILTSRFNFIHLAFPFGWKISAVAKFWLYKQYCDRHLTQKIYFCIFILFFRILRSEITESEWAQFYGLWCTFQGFKINARRPILPISQL